jgi:putative hydrolase of the HAD superfamily
MIRAALFDLGGVILTSPFEAFARYERERGLPDGFIRGLNAADHLGNAWARLERNEVSIDEFCAQFEDEARLAGGTLDGHEVIALLAGELRPAMVEAVRRCHERLSTALLTNNFVALDGGGPVGELLALFDVIVESSRVGVRKPEPAFYAIACEKLGVEPRECVFLDDLGVNLKPARDMGMATIKVTDPDAALAELEAAVGFALRDQTAR